MNTQDVKFRDLRVEDQASLLELFKQLISHEALFSAKKCIDDVNTHCIVVTKDNEIIGFGAVVFSSSPTKGKFATLEDIIIDEGCRSEGLGRELVKRLISVAHSKDIRLIKLTSNPKRVPARNLYQSLGFVQHDTGIFELKSE